MPPFRRRDPDSLPFRISLEAANRTVGLVALGLPLALLGVSALGFGCAEIDSISHYYFTPLGGDLFTGALFVIGAVMLFFYTLPKRRDGRVIDVEHYEGHTLRDFRLARLAGAMAFLVALFPTTDTGCESIAGKTARGYIVDTRIEGSAVLGTPGFDFFDAIGRPAPALDWLHYGAAAVMFAVLAWFCFAVFTRIQTLRPGVSGPAANPVKRWRNRLYRSCGTVIVLAMATILAKLVFWPEGSDGHARWNALNLTFWCESAALAAFGLSWSVKGRIFGALRDPGEENPRAEAAQARSA